MSQLADSKLHLLWSLWTELGVPGPHRTHRHVAIDPEPLIVWTPHLAAADPRLLGLAFDWCLHHAEHVVKVRLPGLARDLAEPAKAAFAGFNGALAAHGVAWRPAGTALPLQPARKAMPLPMDRPALVRFRVRALCGVTARSDVLALLLAHGTLGASASTLTPPGVTRRSVARVLSEMVDAGLVLADETARPVQFRLRDASPLGTVVRAADLRCWNLHALFQLINDFSSLDAVVSKGANVRRVEATKVVNQTKKLVIGLGFDLPPHLQDVEDPFTAVASWALALAESVAQGGAP
jgi:hypothetical protein